MTEQHESPEAQNAPSPLKGGKRITLWVKPVVGGFMAVALWGFFNVSPLPSDEEMIAHFYAHRTEIESLVNHYREYRRPIPAPALEWWQLPEILALQKKAGVERVSDLGSMWLPAGRDGVSRERVRTFASLKWYPPGWKKGECVLHRIEDKWFIRMCWAAV